jgi:hypothetical protein
METKVTEMDPQQLFPELLRLMEETGTVPLLISGGSMAPFLVHGRDTVYLEKPQQRLKRGDMVLYRRSGGRYILHRICRISGDSFTMIGDAQTQREPGITRDQILARVTAVRRKGKLLQKGSFLWYFFEKHWIRMIPLRRAALAVYHCLKK